MIKRIFDVLNDIILFISALGGIAVAIIDYFQLFDNAPIINELVPKMTLLLVGLLATATLLEKRVKLADLEKTVQVTNQAVEQFRNSIDDKLHNDRDVINMNFEKQLAHLKEYQEKVNLITNRRQDFRIIGERLAATSPSARVMITHFEKLSLPYDEGESEEEKLFMENWFPKINAGYWSVQQLVHVSNVRELEEVEERIRHTISAHNYTLSIFVGTISPPYFDLLVINSSFAKMFMSQEINSPMTADISLQFFDKEIIRRLEAYFDVLWAAATPVKTRDGVDYSFIENLRKKLERGIDGKGNAWNFADQELNRLFEKIIDQYSLLEHQPQKELFIEAAKEKALSLSQGLAELLKGTVHLGPDGILTLIASLNKAVGTVICVSCEDTKTFWKTALGHKYLKAHKKIIEKGVKISRIFILEKHELTDVRLLEIMKQQVSSGIEVRVAVSDSIASELKKDFLVKDNELVFYDHFDENGHMQQFSISIEKSEVEKANKTFELLYLQSLDWDEFTSLYYNN